MDAKNFFTMRDTNFCLEEFEVFYNLLRIDNPWFFPVCKEGKNPDAICIAKRKWKNEKEKYSWKASHAQLNKEECIELIKQGFNIGIAARQNDYLVIIDIDSIKHLEQMPSDSLINRSRSRFGLHGFFLKSDDQVKKNIPTDFGEMRCSDQYVLAPGSYVPVTDADLQKYVEKGELTVQEAEQIKNDPYRGYYTIEVAKTPRAITWNEIPKIFKDQARKDEQAMQKLQQKRTAKPLILEEGRTRSALFSLKMNNIVSSIPGRRDPHPLHESDTGQNFSISADGSLCTCWRHEVSLNAIQYLCVRSGYMSCQDAGTPHKSRGVSKIRGDNGAIFHAWLQAKKDKLIPENDPIPVKAMQYIAKHHNLIHHETTSLPTPIYNMVLKIVAKEY